MSEIILYPTETVYALGVNPFDREAWHTVCALKGRSDLQAMSWLVRNVSDIERYAILTPKAREIIAAHLPGPLTIILKAKLHISQEVLAFDGTLSFRISSDPHAQSLIERYMHKNDVPLTCTSANLHGEPTMSTTREIIEQFGEKEDWLTEIIDDGPREQKPSTIVRVVDDVVTIIRQGAIKI